MYSRWNQEASGKQQQQENQTDQSTDAEFFRHASKVPQRIRAVTESKTLPTKRIHHNIPHQLLTALNLGSNSTREYQLLLERSSPLNYLERQHLLLYLEEHHLRTTSGLMIAANAKLTPSPSSSREYFFHGYFTLRNQQRIVLHCKRENIFLDAQVVSKANGRNVICVEEGFVIDTGKQLFDIRHIPKREQFRHLHTAVDNVWKEFGTRLLFGCKKEALPESRRRIEFFDKELDREQREIIEQLLIGGPSLAPYIILGAAGTGKTRTLIELILHLMQDFPWSRVLVCGLTFHSTCLLAKAVDSTGVQFNVPFALLVSDSDLISELDPVLKNKFCMTETLVTSLPNRLFFSTVYDAAEITELCGQLNFTHVILDDCCALTEPEALIPIACLTRNDDKSIQVILAGDLAQLAPEVKSYDGKKFGLADSLLFRMVNLFPYCNSREVRNHLYLTELRINYRSSPGLFNFIGRFLSGDQSLSPRSCNIGKKESEVSIAGGNSSSSSSDSPLCFGPVARQSMSCRALNSPSSIIIPQCRLGQSAIIARDRLLEEVRPVSFVSVRGSEEHFDDLEHGGKWLWNPAEVNAMLDEMTKLTTLTASTPIRICVFSPFQGQLRKIEKAMKNVKKAIMPQVDMRHIIKLVGEEYDIMIVSCVQSSATDGRSHGGFVGCPELSQFIISRVRMGLIVIGDAETLARDVYWKEFLLYAKQQNCFTEWRKK